MGTLGGGNHFIEVCLDDDGRGLADAALRLAGTSARNWPSFHIGQAQKLPHNQGLADRDLAVFVADTPQMDGLPARPVLGAGVRAAQPRGDDGALPGRRAHGVHEGRASTFEPAISCHHNYVAEERYDGMDLLVTRKGAIRAGAGESASSRARWAPVRTS